MKLLFVYNAKSDKISTALDFMHKIASPSTYACQLCTITHGNFGIKKEWEDFIKSLPMESEFLHKDEFQKKYPDASSAFPVVFAINGDVMKMCISVEEMKKMDLQVLMGRISELAIKNN